MAGRYKPTHQKKKRRAKRKERVLFSARPSHSVSVCLHLFFSAFLWREALRVSSQEQGSVSASGEALRPQVGDPPYRVATDAGHGGNDPGARGVVEKKRHDGRHGLRAACMAGAGPKLHSAPDA